MNYDLVIINGDSFSEGNGLYRQFDTYKDECKYYDLWLKLKETSEGGSEVFLDRCFSWGLKVAEILGVPILNISKSGSSNKSILRRWYYISDILPHNNHTGVNEYKIGEENWIFLEPDAQTFTKFDKRKLSNFKNPLCITQWSGAHRSDMVYRTGCFSLNPSMSQPEEARHFLKQNGIPIDEEKFITFFQYYLNLISIDYLVNYESLNILMAFKGLMDMKGYESYSIAHRMQDGLEFGFDKIIGNVLPLSTTKQIENDTYTLKDVGIDNLHYSLEGHEYFGQSILNLTKKNVI